MPLHIPCRYYMQGRCNRGATCCFAHRTQGVPAGRASAGTAGPAVISISINMPTNGLPPGKYHAAASAVTPTAGLMHNNNTGGQLCRAWAEGRCVFDGGCGYIHAKLKEVQLGPPTDYNPTTAWSRVATHHRTTCPFLRSAEEAAMQAPAAQPPDGDSSSSDEIIVVNRASAAERWARDQAPPESCSRSAAECEPMREYEREQGSGEPAKGGEAAARRQQADGDSDPQLKRINIHSNEKEGRVEEAVAKLLEMEKRTRLGGDAKNCMKAATEIMRLLVAAASADKLIEYAAVLMKRRAQMKGVQIVVVKEAQKAVDAAADKEAKMKLLKQLRGMCSGKSNVALEFARISVQMAAILEADGKIEECAELMNEVQVEAITDIERTEKLKILLLQVRLNLDTGDYTRAAIMARKSCNWALSKPDSMLIKADYFQLMLRYYGHFKSYTHLAKCWMELFALTTSEGFQKQHSDHPLASQGEFSLTHVLLYLILSPPKLTEDEKITDCAAFSPWNETADRLELVAKYAGECIARGLGNYQLIAKQFLSEELIHWPQFAERNADLRQHPVFAAMTEGDERWEALRLRVTQHNTKLISSHYQPAAAQAEAVTRDEMLELAAELRALVAREAAQLREQAAELTQKLERERQERADQVAALAQQLERERQERAAEVGALRAELAKEQEERRKEQKWQVTRADGGAAAAASPSAARGVWDVRANEGSKK